MDCSLYSPIRCLVTVLSHAKATSTSRLIDCVVVNMSSMLFVLLLFAICTKLHFTSNFDSSKQQFAKMLFDLHQLAVLCSAEVYASIIFTFDVHK